MVSERLDVIHMILNAGLMVQFVMLLLFLFSVASWAIILIKYFQIRKAYKESAFFVEYFWKNCENFRKIPLNPNPGARQFMYYTTNPTNPTNPTL